MSVTLGMEAREEAVAFRKDDWHGPPYPLRPREADGVAAFVLERADDPLGIGATGDIHYEPLGVLGRVRLGSAQLSAGRNYIIAGR